MQTIYYIIIYYYNVKIFRKRIFVTPNPTTATLSQAMRHSVGAPPFPYINGRYRRLYRRRRLQFATGVDTVQGSESPLQEALQAKASTVRYSRRNLGTCAFARVRCEPSAVCVRLLRRRMLRRARFAGSETPRPALAWRRRPLLTALSLASCSKHKSRGSSSLRYLPAPPPVTTSCRYLPLPWPVTTPSATFRRHRP